MSDQTGIKDQAERHSFEAEVTQLLHLMVHSVYSESEIFLRELISNASDACDRLRYQALTNPELTADDPQLKIAVSFDKAARTVCVSDNGLGMSHDDLVENLGTIARSGTSIFAGALTGDAAKDVSLIGKFGVGFYSVFMVADRVEVTSRRADSDESWIWQSDGLGEYTLEPTEAAKRGTNVLLYLKEDAAEFLERARLERIIKTYSDHIALPVTLAERSEAGLEGADTPVNQASALWTRPRSEISQDQYKEFYHHAGHAVDEPWLTLHYHAEGTIDYTVLVFVPTMPPYNLFDPSRQPLLKLYVRRVFIADDCEDLIPAYLRFLRGVVDSEDLPLNISREMLQNNPVVRRIRSGITNRVLSEFETKAEKDPESYIGFWENFGAVLKEGIYEDGARRDQLLGLARFRSTAGDDWVSLAGYVGRIKEGQDAIYYVTGEDLDAVKRSPQLEGFEAKGVEVLLMTDPVDSFWLTGVADFDGLALKSITRGAAELDKIESAADESEQSEEAVAGTALATLIAVIKQNLGDLVKDVRESGRLTETAACLVSEEGDLDLHLQRLLQRQKQMDTSPPRILEINPRHGVIKALAASAGNSGAVDRLADPTRLLYDQACLAEGGQLPDPAGFSRRLERLLENSLVENSPSEKSLNVAAVTPGTTENTPLKP